MVTSLQDYFIYDTVEAKTKGTNFTIYLSHEKVFNCIVLMIFLSQGLALCPMTIPIFNIFARVNIVEQPCSNTLL